ncbi:MAG TPA: hemerythrin domain-containing protein [Azospirillum sp.]
MKALRIISDEHQSLAAILHAVRFMLKEISAGRLTPDLELFQAMVHYLDAYAEQRHHPREDVLFRALRECTGEGGEGAEALDTLAAEHAAGPQRIATLRRALDDFIADPRGVEAFSEAFDRYADFYRGHMLLEEDVVLPLVRRHLTAEQWDAAEREIQAAEAKQADGDTAGEDFRALFSRLVECAPAPIGHGAHPFAKAN